MSIGGSHIPWGDPDSPPFLKARKRKSRLRLSDISPIILRSAGIVGIAASIMLVVSNGIWTSDPRPNSSASTTDVAIRDASEQPVAQPEAQGGALMTDSGEEPAAPDVTPELAVASLEPAGVVPDIAGPQAPVAAAPVAATPAVDTTTPDAQAAAAEMAPTRAVAEAATAEPEAAPQTIAALSTDAEPVAERVLEEPPAVGTQPDAAAIERARRAIAMAVEAEQAAPPRVMSVIEPVAVEATPAADADSPFTEHAVECPRDWVAGDASGEIPAGCQTIAALIPADVEADEQAALSAAAEDYAALLPRPPRARPDPGPNPIREVREQRRQVARGDMSWPDQNPPDCGSKHARWRFVNEARTQKEWYCR